jgi:glycerate-2-kinase
LPDDAEVRFLKSLCAAATAAAAPARCRPPHLPGERTGRRLVTGPTLTNVNDFHTILVS